jgi:hypothetical protein
VYAPLLSRSAPCSQASYEVWRSFYLKNNENSSPKMPILFYLVLPEFCMSLLDGNLSGVRVCESRVLILLSDISY